MAAADTPSRTAGETSSRAKKAANEAITQSEFEAQIETLREEFAKLVSQAQSSGNRSYGAAKRAAAVGVENLRVRGESAMDDLRTNARDIEDQMAQAVRDKPVTSLAIAAGVGFLFALIARR